jgi:hypothetical protein
MPEQKMHKYKITNTANGPVHIKEMRKAISAKKEGEFVGVLTEGTKRLEEKGFISIKDLGAVKPEDIPKRVLSQNPLQRKAAQEEKERELTAKVRENLKKIKKEEEPKAKVEPVSATEMGVKEAPKPPPVPALEEEKPAKKKKAKKSD